MSEKIKTQEEKTAEIKQKPIELPIFTKGNIVLGQYKIIDEIARGGMNSIIYKAEDTFVDKNDYFALQNKYVAIKVVTRNPSISDGEWIKFLDECVTTKRVNNLNNIVRTFQVEKINNDNTIIIVMEYVDGISLRDHLNKHGYLSVKEATFIFEKVLIAIKELHSFKHKIIHRDLKPENILLSHDLRQVKIIDFGISSVIEFTNNDENKILTNEATLYGTYPYISPDVFKMARSNDKNANNFISEQFDFFSLGIIFYEMLIGKKPFFSSNYSSIEVIKLPLKFDMPIMSDINPNITPAIENIIFRCIASKPEDIKYRYHSVQEIINDLKNVSNTTSINEKLLKPSKDRTFQIKNIFDTTKQRQHEKFYQKWWFIFVILLLALVIIIITVVIKVIY